MMKTQPKTTLTPTNIAGLYKDTRTNIVVNKNLGEYDRVLASRKKKKADDHLRMEVANLKNDVADIKNDLKEIITVLRKQNG